MGGQLFEVGVGCSLLKVLPNVRTGAIEVRLKSETCSVIEPDLNKPVKTSALDTGNWRQRGGSSCGSLDRREGGLDGRGVGLTEEDEAAKTASMARAKTRTNCILEV